MQTGDQKIVIILRDGNFSIEGDAHSPFAKGLRTFLDQLEAEGRA